MDTDNEIDDFIESFGFDGDALSRGLTYAEASRCIKAAYELGEKDSQEIARLGI